MERIIPQQMGPEETQKVLRRAAALDRQHAPVGAAIAAAHEPRIDAAELERIAAESGLSPESVRRARLSFLAEHGVDLGPQHQRERR